jgi:UPF0271 protein
MKLNCDLGESFGSWKMGLDEAVMPNIDQANIACGFHAGDPDTMQRTLNLAKMHNVEVGAHPGYQDLSGFGRRSIPHTPQQISNLVTYQTGALIGMASSIGLEVSYVKPHGALYNDMMKDADIRFAIYQAIKGLNQSHSVSLKLMILATADAEIHRQEASTFGVELLLEAFADRRYTDLGTLTPRTEAGAVLNAEEMIEQVKLLSSKGIVVTGTGNQLPISADSICVHGDNQAGVTNIKAIRAHISGR